MTPQKNAERLVHKYRMLLMDEGENYGEEILVSILSKQCALIAAENIRTEMVQAQNYERAIYWRDVKSQIKQL
jgi:hypothetical protein